MKQSPRAADGSISRIAAIDEPGDAPWKRFTQHAGEAIERGRYGTAWPRYRRAWLEARDLFEWAAADEPPVGAEPAPLPVGPPPALLRPS